MQSAGGAVDTSAATEEPAHEGAATTRFTDAGPKPPVVHHQGHAPAGPTASERAYGGGEATMASEDVVDHAAIAEASKSYGIPEAEIRAIITQESRGDADANAGKHQKDHGKHAASGLMQMTESSWRQAQHTHPELAAYSFSAYRYDRKINILVGTAVLADKRAALARLGISSHSPQIAQLTSMAYNGGEGLVADAYQRARDAGSKHPDVDCLKPEYLKPAIEAYPSVYAYYLTGGGKAKNPQRTVERAVELKYLEISKYPAEITALLAADEERTKAHREDDAPVAAHQPGHIT